MSEAASERAGSGGEISRSDSRSAEFSFTSSTYRWAHRPVDWMEHVR
ncbi:hypothetical protein [Mycolicibacterium mengxianglii]|nr:hypothetical protein [Mycolicibacterium mengxianglii]